MKQLSLEEAWETGQMRAYICQEEAAAEAWLDGSEEAEARRLAFIGPPRPPEKTWEEREREREEEFAMNAEICAGMGGWRKRWRDEHNEY